MSYQYLQYVHCECLLMRRSQEIMGTEEVDDLKTCSYSSLSLCYGRMST
jgi:hypothetical protein